MFSTGASNEESYELITTTKIEKLEICVKFHVVKVFVDNNHFMFYKKFTLLESKYTSFIYKEIYN